MVLPEPVDWYVRPSEVRARGRLTTAGTPDEVLHPLIAHTSRRIDDWCNRRFGVVRGTVVVPGGWTSTLVPDCISIELAECGDGQTWTPLTGWTLLADGTAPHHARLLAYCTGPYLRLTGLWGYSWTVAPAGQLTAPMDADQNSASFSQSDIDVGDVLAIGDEQVQVVTASGSTATVTRGVNGTVAAPHPAGTPVYRRVYPGAITEAALMQVIRRLTDQAAGFAGVLASSEVGAGQPWQGAYPDIRDAVERFRLPGVA